ncbi:MAG: acyloxyacyl hydrolase [Crocinitomicaceae bacterium]
MKHIAVIFFVVIQIAGYAQFVDRFKPTQITATTNLGFVIAHHSNMIHLLQRDAHGIELNFSQQDRKQTAWSTLYRGAVRGLSFKFHDFGNPKELGYAYTMFGHTSFPLYQGPKFGFLDFRIGTGLAYLTRKFDPETNPKNNAIGSYLNGFVNLMFNYNKHFRWWHFGFGLEFSHYSNCATKVPNLGLNVPSLNVNLGFNLEQRTAIDKKEINENTEASNYDDVMSDGIYLIGFLTAKQNVIKQKEAITRPVMAIQGLYDLKMGSRWKLNVAMDIIYNDANRHYYDTSTYTIGQTIQLGAFVGAGIHFYKAEFTAGMGVYYWSPVRPFGMFYHRLGFRYHFTNNLVGTIGIKSHFAIADYLELGIGYRLWNRK